MSEDKRVNEMELKEESLKRVDGGFNLLDLFRGKEEKPEAENLPAGGRSFEIKSSIATGEKIADASEMSNGEKQTRTGKRNPKIIFRDKGKSI